MLSVAVIVANRNNAPFLVQCLESALNQTLRPEQIIVADDASTDNSLEVLAPYVRDGAVLLVRNAVQQGVAASRQLAIRQSGSQYITTLDSDDFYFTKEKLAQEADTIGRAGKRGRIAFSDVMRVDELGHVMGLVSRSRRIREGDLSFRIRHLSGFIPRDYLVSREDYLAVGGFDTSLRIYEDWDLKIRLSRKCTWHYSHTVGTAYRSNPRGLSRAVLSEHVSTMRNIFSKYSAPHGIPRALAMARFFVYHSLYLRRPAV